MLASRATDRNGSVQPEIPPQNERGYATTAGVTPR